MKTRTTRRITAVVCFLSAAVATAQESSWTWQQVAPGVVAALQPDAERFDDANVTFIDWGDDSLIMVDAPAKAERLAQLLEQLAARTERAVRWIINTHWHADHTQGNSQVIEAFPGATIIGQRTHLEDVSGRAEKRITDRVERLESLIPAAKEQLALGKDEEGNELDAEGIAQQTAGIERAEAWLAAHRDVLFVMPSVVVNDRLTLHDGERRIDLYALRAHTRGDLVVHLPDRGVLITGDVVDDLPYIGHGYPRGWIEALDAMEELKPTVIVPGHGPVFESTDQLQRVRGFLVDLVAQVEEQLEGTSGSEIDLEQLAKTLDLGRWRQAMVRDAASERFFDGVLAEAVARVVEELRGFDGEEGEVSQ